MIKCYFISIKVNFSTIKYWLIFEKKCTYDSLDTFLTAIFIFLALDLGVFNKNPHIISSKEASSWTLLWVTLSFLFSGIIFLLYKHEYIANPTELKPQQAVIKYITGYLIELSLVLTIFL